MWMWNALTPGLKFWRHGPQTLVLNWHVVVSLRGGTIEEVNYWVLESPCELYLSPCSDLSTLLSHPPTCEQASSCTCHHMIPNTKYYIPLCSGPSQSFLPRAVCARHSATAAGKLTHLLAAMKLALWVCWVSLVGGGCHSGSSYVSMAPFEQSVFAVLVGQLFPSSVNLMGLILFLFSCLFLTDLLWIRPLVRYMITNLCISLPLSAFLCMSLCVSVCFCICLSLMWAQHTHIWVLSI